MSAEPSITLWISQLKQGDHEAANKIWSSYAERLAEFARTRLKSLPPGAVDEDDIAQNVFWSLCKAADAGRLQQMQDRDELWWILMGLVRRKVVDHIRRETSAKRGAGNVKSASNIHSELNGSTCFSFDELMDVRPTPEYVVAMNDQFRDLMEKLRDDRLRKIAELRIEGYSIAEIADFMDVTSKTVGRKLRLIRTTWSEELNRANTE